MAHDARVETLEVSVGPDHLAHSLTRMGIGQTSIESLEQRLATETAKHDAARMALKQEKEKVDLHSYEMARLKEALVSAGGASDPVGDVQSGAVPEESTPTLPATPPRTTAELGGGHALAASQEVRPFLLLAWETKPDPAVDPRSGTGSRACSRWRGRDAGSSEPLLRN